MRDDAALVDEKGGAHDAEADLAVELLFLPDSIGLNDHALGIGEKGEGQRILFCKFFVRGDAVAADADDGNAASLKFGVCARKGTDLTDITGRALSFHKI